MDNPVRISLAVAAVLIIVIGLVLRWARDRRANQRAGTTAPTVAAPPSGGYPPQTGAMVEYVVRKVRPVPEKTPPRIRVSAAGVEWVNGDGSPGWRAAPNQVSIEYKAASALGVNVPTAVISGPDAGTVRGRVTADLRGPVGGFDRSAEEAMARDLLDFVQHAAGCGVQVTGSGPIPTRAQVEGQRITRV